MEEDARRLVQRLEWARRRAAADVADATGRYDRDAAEIAARRARDEAVVRTRAGNLVAAATSAIADVVVSSCPGTASEGWEHRTWAEPTPGFPGPIRVGSLRIDVGAAAAAPVEVPALVPLVGRSNLVLRSPRESRSILPLVHGVVLRSLISVPPGHLRVHVVDPRGLGEGLAAFSRLRDGEGSVLEGGSRTNERQIAELFEGLVDQVTRVSEQVLRGEHPDLITLHRRSGRFVEPYHLVVVLDAPAELTRDSCIDLRRLAERGPAAGVSLLFHHDTSLPAVDGAEVASLESHSTVFDLVDARHGSTPLAPGSTFTVDVAPPQTLIDRVCSYVGSGARAAATPDVSFDRLLDQAKWTRSSAERLTVNIGEAGTNPVAIDFDDDTVNALVGGKAGSGKSNLLQVVIHGLAWSYSPSELELVVLDFKEGLEFAQLVPSQNDTTFLPHARIVSIESAREFGLAVLEQLVQELERRALLLKAAGARKLADLRRSRPDEPLPRILLVVDEFQHLLQPYDQLATRAVGLLETLARKGRAYGVHMLLASQSVSGIQVLDVKRDAIFGQFPLRLALMNTPAESTVILGQFNQEAAELRFQGEIVVNRRLGHHDANERAVVARAPDDSLRQIRARLVADLPARARRPEVFAGGEPADLRECAPLLDALVRRAPASGSSGREVWLGRPVAPGVPDAAVDLAGGGGGHLVVVGDPDSARNTIQAALISLAAQVRPRGAKVVILDLDGSARDLGLPAERLGLEVQQTDFESAGSALEQLAERTVSPHDRPTYVLGLGLERLPMLAGWEPYGADGPYAAFQSLVERGPHTSLHLLGVWPNASFVSSVFPYDKTQFIRAVVLHAWDKQALAQFTGDGLLEVDSAPNRSLLIDHSTAGPPLLLRPYGRIPSDLGWLHDPVGAAS